MDEKVREELDVLVLKLNDWRNSYLRQATGDGDEYLINELKEDVSTWMAPYVRRFEELEYITRAEADEFWGKIRESFEEFIQDIQSGKTIKVIEKVDIKSLLHKFEVHKHFIESSYGDTEFKLEQKMKMVNLAIKLIPALVQKLDEYECSKGEE